MKSSFLVKSDKIVRVKIRHVSWLNLQFHGKTMGKSQLFHPGAPRLRGLPCETGNVASVTLYDVTQSVAITQDSFGARMVCKGKWVWT